MSVYIKKFTKSIGMSLFFNEFNFLLSAFASVVKEHNIPESDEPDFLRPVIGKNASLESTGEACKILMPTNCEGIYPGKTGKRSGFIRSKYE